MHKILANTLFLGKRIFYLPECHSTNDVALEKFKQKEASEGSIIITERQTQGRGQRGNTWESTPGKNLTFSLILRPQFLEAREQFGLNIAISLGIREALSSYSEGIQVKWPNDIVHKNGGKIGGVLIENTISRQAIESSIVGIGLNINQTAFPFPHASSMSLLCGAPLDKEEVFEAVILQIEHFYLLLKNRKEKTLKELYQTHLFKFNQLSFYDDGEKFRGKIIGIAEQGNLIIEKESGGLYQYGYKEVQFL